MNPLTDALARQPILINLVVTVLTWVGTRYVPGLELSPEQSTAIAGAVLTGGSLLARSAVTTLRRPRNNAGEILVPVTQVPAVAKALAKALEANGPAGADAPGLGEPPAVAPPS